VKGVRLKGRHKMQSSVVLQARVAYIQETRYLNVDWKVETRSS
jgi:hypothetical protein